MFPSLDAPPFQLPLAKLLVKVRLPVLEEFVERGVPCSETYEKRSKLKRVPGAGQVVRAGVAFNDIGHLRQRKMVRYERMNKEMGTIPLGPFPCP